MLSHRMLLVCGICKLYEGDLQTIRNSLHPADILVQLPFHMQDKHGLLNAPIAVTLRT